MVETIKLFVYYRNGTRIVEKVVLNRYKIKRGVYFST